MKYSVSLCFAFAPFLWCRNTLKMNSAVEVVTTRRGAIAVRVNGYVYRKNFEKNGTATWRCSKGCTASCKTKTSGFGSGLELIYMKGEHDHQPEVEIVSIRRAIRASVKRKAAEDLGGKPSKILCNAIKGHEADLTVRDLDNFR